MEIRSKSFQNCREAEIPGYNDCPSFLFQVNKAAAKVGKRNAIMTEVRDVNGNTKANNIPPPPLTNKNSRRRLDNETAGSAEQDKALSKDELLDKVEALCSLESKLSPQEFEFYKKKVDANLSRSLDLTSTRRVLTSVFKDSTGKVKAQSILRDWLTSDTTISNWCPAFLKIFENSADNDI